MTLGNITANLAPRVSNFYISDLGDDTLIFYLSERALKIYYIKFLNIAGTENWTNSEGKENDWMSGTKSFVNMFERKKMDSDFGNWGSCNCETNCKIDKCKLLWKLK